MSSAAWPMVIGTSLHILQGDLSCANLTACPIPILRRYGGVSMMLNTINDDRGNIWIVILYRRIWWTTCCCRAFLSDLNNLKHLYVIRRAFKLAGMYSIRGDKSEWVMVAVDTIWLFWSCPESASWYGRCHCCTLTCLTTIFEPSVSRYIHLTLFLAWS